MGSTRTGARLRASAKACHGAGPGTTPPPAARVPAGRAGAR